MSNKTSDKNVVTEEDLEVLNEVLLHNRETEQARIAIEHMLAEREQKDKRIQELENKLQDINTYILINGIDEPLRTATQIQVKNQHEYIIQQKINKLEEERDHWHGCFIVAMENSIAKEKVIEAFEDIEDYFDRLNGPDEDMDYIRQVKQELLEGEK